MHKHQKKYIHNNIVFPTSFPTGKFMLINWFFFLIKDMVQNRHYAIEDKH